MSKPTEHKQNRGRHQSKNVQAEHYKSVSYVSQELKKLHDACSLHSTHTHKGSLSQGKLLLYGVFRTFLTTSRGEVVPHQYDECANADQMFWSARMNAAYMTKQSREFESRGFN